MTKKDLIKNCRYFLNNIYTKINCNDWMFYDVDFKNLINKDFNYLLNRYKRENLVYYYNLLNTKYISLNF